MDNRDKEIYEYAQTFPQDMVLTDSMWQEKK